MAGLLLAGVVVSLDIHAPRGARDLPQASLGLSSSGLRDWLVVGPFHPRDASDVVDEDTLSAFGLSETVKRPEDVREWIDRWASHAQGDREQTFIVVRNQEGVDLNDLFHLPELNDGFPPNVAYLACILNVDNDRTASLVLGSDDAAKVWVNGTPVFRSTEDRTLFAAADVVRVDLRRGPNLLFAKVCNRRQKWGWTAKLEPSLEAGLISAGKNRTGIWRSEEVTSARPLELCLDLAATDVIVHLKVFSPNRGLEANAELSSAHGNWQPPLSWPDGIYSVTVHAASGQFSDRICIGDLRKTAERVSADLSRCSADSKLMLDASALRRRIEILLHPANYLPDDRNWRRKLVFTLGEAEQLSTTLGGDRKTAIVQPGVHIRAYQSRIDGCVQHYRVYLPEPRTNTAPGLLVVPPTVTSASRPFIESAFIADQKGAELFGVLAERYYLAIIWPGFRCQPYGSPCDFAHFDEALAAFRGDFSWDPHRTYLYGTCGGGMLAAMYAIRRPEFFAAIALRNPALHRWQNRDDDLPEFQHNPNYERWLAVNDPMNGLVRLRSVPVRIIHDGAEPGHGPIEDSLEFMEKARKADHLVILDQIDKSHLLYTQLDGLFNWLATQHRDVHSDRKVAVRLDNAPSISTTFVAPFVVIRGTTGTVDETESLRKVADDFAAAWRRTHFGECRVETDTALAEVAGWNLVLVGSAETNLWWKRLVPDISAKRLIATATSAAARDQQPCSFQTVARHPRAPGHLLVLLGGSDPTKLSFGTLDLSVDGWFATAVWCNGSELVSAGYDGP